MVLPERLALKGRPDVHSLLRTELAVEAADVYFPELLPHRVVKVGSDKGALPPALLVAEGIIARGHAGDGVLAEQAQQPVLAAVLAEVMPRESGSAHAFAIRL